MINFILIPFAAFTWAHLIGIVQRFKWAFKIKKLKPFDCELCLSFWMVAIRSYMNGELIFNCILYGFIAGGISNTIYLIYRKLNLI